VKNNHGIIVNDANSENNVRNNYGDTNCVMIFDTNPELKAMGKKTTTITKVIDVTVPPISAVPSCCTDAVFPFPCAYIYFQTTMASSTKYQPQVINQQTH
jgi:hypothetical protein